MKTLISTIAMLLLAVQTSSALAQTQPLVATGTIPQTNPVPGTVTGPGTGAITPGLTAPGSTFDRAQASSIFGPTTTDPIFGTPTLPQNVLPAPTTPILQNSLGATAPLSTSSLPGADGSIGGVGSLPGSSGAAGTTPGAAGTPPSALSH